MKGQGGTPRSLGQKPQGMLLPEGEVYRVRVSMARHRWKGQDMVTESAQVWKWDGTPPWRSEKSRDANGNCFAATGCETAPQRTEK